MKEQDQLISDINEPGLSRQPERTIKKADIVIGVSVAVSAMVGLVAATEGLPVQDKVILLRVGIAFLSSLCGVTSVHLSSRLHKH